MDIILDIIVDLLKDILTDNRYFGEAFGPLTCIQDSKSISINSVNTILVVYILNVLL